jgi:hypothetical protein
VTPHGGHKYPHPPSPADLGLLPGAAAGRRAGTDAGRRAGADAGRRAGADLTRMKKFRFQLLAEWISGNFPPCAVADVGGGKGLLAYLLQGAGFSCTVIDPVDQALPAKYRDLGSGRQVKIPASASVPRLTQDFRVELAERFDLLVALHAHGVNLQILDAVRDLGVSCVVLPCCVIGERSVPEADRDLLTWLTGQARESGLPAEYFYLNFKGRSTGFRIRGKRP